MRALQNEKSGIFLEQNVSYAKQKAENTDIHQENFGGCCIRF